MIFSDIANAFVNEMGYNFGKILEQYEIILIPSDHGRLRMIYILDHIDHHMVITQKKLYHMLHKSKLHNISTINITL